MKVMEPMSYEIEFTDEEEKIITDCATLLDNIYSTMKKHECQHIIDTSNDEIMVDIHTIDKISGILNSLTYANVIE